MAGDPPTDEPGASHDTAVRDSGISATVSVRALAAATELQMRAQAERCLPEGWGVGELTRKTMEGDEVVLEFDVVTG